MLSVSNSISKMSIIYNLLSSVMLAGNVPAANAERLKNRNVSAGNVIINIRNVFVYESAVLHIAVC